MTPIAEHLLDRARRTTARRIASALIECMARTDMSFSVIAYRVGKDEVELRKWLYGMIDGKSDTGLSEISDFALAMGAELDFTIRPCEFLNEPEPETEAPAAAISDA